MQSAATISSSPAVWAGQLVLVVVMIEEEMLREST